MQTNKDKKPEITSNLAVKSLPLARKILILCHDLTKISEENVEDFIPIAKEIAITTEQLSDFINQQVNQMNDSISLPNSNKNSDKIGDALFLVNDILSQCITDLQLNVLELVKATKSAIQNPCSYSSFERVSNCTDLIFKNIDDFNTAIDLLQIFSCSSTNAYTNDPQQKKRYKVILESASQFASDIQLVIDAIPSSSPSLSITNNQINVSTNMNNLQTINAKIKVQKAAEVLITSCHRFIVDSRNEINRQIQQNNLNHNNNTQNWNETFDDVIETTKTVIFFSNLITNTFLSSSMQKKTKEEVDDNNNNNDEQEEDEQRRNEIISEESLNLEKAKIDLANHIKDIILKIVQTCEINNNNNDENNANSENLPINSQNSNEDENSDDEFNSEENSEEKNIVESSTTTTATSTPLSQPNIPLIKPPQVPKVNRQNPAQSLSTKGPDRAEKGMNRKEYHQSHFIKVKNPILSKQLNQTLNRLNNKESASAAIQMIEQMKVKFPWFLENWSKESPAQQKLLIQRLELKINLYNHSQNNLTKMNKSNQACAAIVQINKLVPPPQKKREPTPYPSNHHFNPSPNPSIIIHHSHHPSGLSHPAPPPPSSTPFQSLPPPPIPNKKRGGPPNGVGGGVAGSNPAANHVPTGNNNSNVPPSDLQRKPLPNANRNALRIIKSPLIEPNNNNNSGAPPVPPKLKNPANFVQNSAGQLNRNISQPNMINNNQHNNQHNNSHHNNQVNKLQVPQIVTNRLNANNMKRSSRLGCLTQTSTVLHDIRYSTALELNQITKLNTKEDQFDSIVFSDATKNKVIPSPSGRSPAISPRSLGQNKQANNNINNISNNAPRNAPVAIASHIPLFFTSNQEHEDSRLSLSTSSYVDTIAKFHISIEAIVHTFSAIFQPNQKKINSSLFRDQIKKSLALAREVLLLISMQRNELAAEPPPKLEQTIIHRCFQSLKVIVITMSSIIIYYYYYYYYLF